MNRFIGLILGVFMMSACQKAEISAVHTAESGADINFVALAINHTIDDGKELPGGLHLIEHLILSPKRNDEFNELVSKSKGDFNGLTTPGVVNLFYSINNENLNKSIDLLRGRIEKLDLSDEVLDYEIKRFEKEIANDKSESMRKNEAIFAYFDNEIRNYTIGHEGVVSSMGKNALRKKIWSLHKQILEKGRINLFVAGKNVNEKVKVEITSKAPLTGSSFLSESKVLPKELSSDKYHKEYISVYSDCQLSDLALEFLSEKIQEKTGVFSSLLTLYSSGKNTLYELTIKGGQSKPFDLSSLNTEGYVSKKAKHKIKKLNSMKWWVLSKLVQGENVCNAKSLNEWIELASKSPVVSFER